MKTVIRWGAILVIAATTATPLANDGAEDALGVEPQALMMERYSDPDAKTNDRAEGGATTAEPARAAEARPQHVVVPTATNDSVAEAGTGAGSAAPTEAEDESASFDDRWLLEREGYKDGGY
jgi:hypothetical protein